MAASDQNEIQALRARVAELEAMRDRLLEWADALEREAPKPQMGGHFADEVRRKVHGDGNA